MNNSNGRILLSGIMLLLMTGVLISIISGMTFHWLWVGLAIPSLIRSNKLIR